MTAEEALELAGVAWAAVQEIYKLVESAKAGTITAADATASLTSMKSAIAADNTAADAALAAKFP
jgi:hypothetical protein